MMNQIQTLKTGLISLLAFSLLTVSAQIRAENRSALDNDIHAAVESLKKNSAAAANLGKSAKGVLIFPTITKAGFIAGAQYGEGALIKPKAGGGYYIDEYFSLAAGSFGFQAGVQTFGYALVLMTDDAVEFVETTSGWELGAGPSITIVDEGLAKTLSTTTAKEGIYAFTFGQKGLMGGMGLQGTKVSRLR